MSGPVSDIPARTLKQVLAEEFGLSNQEAASAASAVRTALSTSAPTVTLSASDLQALITLARKWAEFLDDTETLDAVLVRISEVPR